MNTELDVFREHFDRYRAVTLQFLDIVPPDKLTWRPDDSSFTVGEHLQHIAQTEHYYRLGLFHGTWDPGILRLTEDAHRPESLRDYFSTVRDATSKDLGTRSDADLARSMRTGEPSRVEGALGLHVLEIMHAVLTSADLPVRTFGLTARYRGLAPYMGSTSDPAVSHTLPMRCCRCNASAQRRRISQSPTGRSASRGRGREARHPARPRPNAASKRSGAPPRSGRAAPSAARRRPCCR